MAPEEHQRVGDLLIEEGIVTREDVARLVGEAGLKGTALAQLLERAHHVRRADLAAFLAGDFVVPLIPDLRKFDLYEEAAKLVPESIARKHEIVPLAKMGDVLCIARPTYFNKAGIAELRKLTGLRVKVFQAEEEQALAALDRIYGKKAVEIPPPKSAPAAASARPGEETADGIPLIALPEEPDPTPVLTPPAAAVPTLEEIALEPVTADAPGATTPVFEAIRLSRSDLEEEERRAGITWVRDFEETFLGSRPMTPIRMA
ncbi:MAG: hypothetical protein HYY17_10870 [Planctomycetes bacterium]|nr:hypothetical protein [Planctomycetota bacterium]